METGDEIRERAAVEEVERKVENAARMLRRRLLLLAFMSLVVGGAYLGVMAAGGSVRLREFATGSAESSQWVVVGWYLLFFTLIYNAVHFPVSYLRGYVVERRFRLSTQRFRRWLWAEVKKYLVSTGLVVFLGEFLYVFLRRFEGTWWFWAWAAYVAFGLVLSRYGSRVLLPLFYKREELADEALEGRLVKLVERAGFSVSTIKRIVVAGDTRRANAALAGLGGTREILVSDTLLEVLEPEEVEAVVAHELGHAKQAHSALLVAVGAVVSFVGFFSAAAALALWTHRLGIEEVHDVAGFPLIVLVFAGLYMALGPAMNYLSRQLERSADMWAARFTGSGEALASALEKLASTNLTERTRPKYYEVLFSSHPSVSTRCAYLRKVGTGGRGGD